MDNDDHATMPPLLKDNVKTEKEPIVESKKRKLEHQPSEVLKFVTNISNSTTFDIFTTDSQQFRLTSGNVADSSEIETFCDRCTNRMYNKQNVSINFCQVIDNNWIQYSFNQFVVRSGSKTEIQFVIYINEKRYVLSEPDRITFIERFSQQSKLFVDKKVIMSKNEK